MITLPPLAAVAPGDPITSEGMNNLLNAVKMVADFLNHQRGTLAVHALNQANNQPVTGAVVTVKPTGAGATRPARAAAFAGADVQAYQVDQLLPGTYDVTVEAAGFNTATQSITMPDTGDPLSLTIPLSVVEATFPIPQLFGQPLTQAVAAVTGQGFTVGRIIDSHGNDVVAAAIPSDLATLPVLGQWPPAGTAAPKSMPVFIHTSAKAEFSQKVKVPSLAGLTINDAKTLLEANNLALGTTVLAGGGGPVL